MSNPELYLNLIVEIPRKSWLKICRNWDKKRRLRIDVKDSRSPEELCQGKYGRDQADTHQPRNVPLQFLVVVRAGVFQGRIKPVVPNVKRQEEEGDPDRQLG